MLAVVPVYTLILSLLVAILSATFFFLLYKKNERNLKKQNGVLTTLREMDKIMMSTVGLDNVAQLVTDAVVSEMNLDMGVLALIDREKGVLRRIAMSNTSDGIQAKRELPIPYEQVGIPLTYDANYTIKAINEKKLQITNSLYSILSPAISKETCDKIQKSSGLKTFLVYPISVRGEIKGIMIISLRRELAEVTSYEKDAFRKLMDSMGIALDNAFLYENLRVITEKLSVANTRLKQLDVLKDDFVSIASHELRTPMTAIRSYAWMALNRSDIPLSEKLKRYITRTLISTERLINLVNEMLNISRIESGKLDISPSPFDIHKLLNEIYSEVEIKLKEKNLKLIIDDCNIQVFADPNKVHQVLLNLIGNAMKFTHMGTEIEIKFFSDGKMLETSVVDHGVGISRDDLSALFKKFGRLDNSYVAAATNGGSGLGLYISKSLIELMHGKIWAVSEGPGEGSTFTFSLPLATKDVLMHPERYKISAIGEAKGLESIAI